MGIKEQKIRQINDEIKAIDKALEYGISMQEAKEFLIKRRREQKRRSVVLEKLSKIPYLGVLASPFSKINNFTNNQFDKAYDEDEKKAIESSLISRRTQLKYQLMKLENK